MSFFDFSSSAFRAVAADETQSPPLFVVVGDYGVIIYSVDRALEDGFEILVFEQAEPLTWRTLYDVDFGNGKFLAASESGMVLISHDGSAWSMKDVGLTENLFAITYVSSSTFVAVGYDGVCARTSNLGVGWTLPSTGISYSLHGIASNGPNLMAVGEKGRCSVSTDSGLTWVGKYAGTQETLRGVVYGNSKWVIVGDNGWITETVDGNSFTLRTSPIDTDYYSVEWSGGLFVAVGKDGDTITSTTGEVWERQKSGVDVSFLYDVRYLDERFITVGSESTVAYSLSGSGRPSFDLFYPVSDQYRSVAFAQYGAYMLYIGMREFEEGQWNYYPRRIRNPAPASVDDFDGIGSWFADLPGTGALLDGEAIRGGIVLAESDQLSLLTDGGSLAAPWMYHQKYGEGLRMISNLCSVNGAAFGIAADGLIYRATVNGVERLPGFFDLTQFDDWNPGTEVVWMDFDPTFQQLFVFRPASPWIVSLVNDDSGAVSELAVPTLSIDSDDYEPRSVFTVQGEMDGLHVSYSTEDIALEDLVVMKLNLDGAITGQDVPASGSLTRVNATIETGSFRVTKLGLRGDLNEVLVRTWADEDSTVRPDIIVRIRDKSENPWQSPEDQTGTITVTTSACTGSGVAWSRYIAEGDDASQTFTLPWLVEQCDIFIDTAGTKVAASYTVVGPWMISLDDVLASGEKLYVNPGPARPFVKGRIGDYIESDEGLHRISAVVTAYELELDWYPSAPSAGAYIPAQEIPAGGDDGDGHLVFGLGRGFDQMMIQVLMLPHDACDAVGAKIMGLELGYRSTGQEMETDNGG